MRTTGATRYGLLAATCRANFLTWRRAIVVGVISRACPLIPERDDAASATTGMRRWQLYALRRKLRSSEVITRRVSNYLSDIAICQLLGKGTLSSVAMRPSVCLSVCLQKH